jgi:hypothetical protein
MRQASRRSWRIGQRHPVRVIYFAYRGTLQAQALQLTAKKLQASLAVEGDLVEDGLAAHGTDGDDLLLALARSLSAGDEVSEESLEGLFAEVRQAAGQAEAAMHPDDLTPADPESATESPTVVASRPDAASGTRLRTLSGPMEIARDEYGPVAGPREAPSPDTDFDEWTPPREAGQLRLF